MKTQAHFEDIQLHILHELRKAQESIHIAVAWFTDSEIFEQLCQMAQAGVRVELIIINDSINRKSNIEFQRLSSAHSDEIVHLIRRKPSSRSEAN